MSNRRPASLLEARVVIAGPRTWSPAPETSGRHVWVDSLDDARLALAEEQFDAAIVSDGLLRLVPSSAIGALRAARPGVAIIVASDEAPRFDEVARWLRAGVTEVVGSARLADHWAVVVATAVTRADLETGRGLGLSTSHPGLARWVLAAGREAIIATDEAATIIHWNQAATELYGWSPDRALGHPVAMMGGFGARIATVGLGASSEATGWARDCWVRRADGALIAVAATCTPLIEDGALVGVMVVASDATDRKQAAAIMRQLSAIAGSASEAIISIDPTGTILTWNPGAERLYGYTAAEAVGMRSSALWPADGLEGLDAALAAIGRGETLDRVAATRRHKDGHDLHVVVSTLPLLDDDGEVVGAYSLATDVSEQVKAVAEREAAEARFEAAFKHSAFGMIIADLDAFPRSVNSATCALLGRPASELVGRRWTDFSHPDDVVHHDAVLAQLAEGQDSFSGEWRYIRPDGSVVWVLLTSTLVRNGSGTPLYFMTQLQDITDRKTFERELSHRALHDELTGLPNRTLLNDRLEHALAASTRRGTVVGVAFLDLDRFKHVNDALGHAVGDQLLVEVGRRLRASVRLEDTVGRFGGDEFVVVYEEASPDSMPLIAERLTAALAQPFPLGDTTITVQASIGLSLSRPGTACHSLLSEADAAMYRAKQRGPGRVEMFDESLRLWATEQLEGERALRQALTDGLIVAYYQPIVDLRSNVPLGVEALARWVTARGTTIPPTDFIPIAERTGLITELGGHILIQSLTQVAAWNRTAPDKPLWASVNISARQLTDTGLPATVAFALDRSGLDPRLLHLEITESVIMDDVPTALKVLHALKDLGLGLAIDDFGTGYSSLAYLRQLPVDTLKIDRSFVQALEESPDTSIIQAVLALTATLGLEVVAEGVETDHQRTTLDRLGCTLAQGYLWSPAIPADALAAWVSAAALRDPPAG